MIHSHRYVHKEWLFNILTDDFTFLFYLFLQQRSTEMLLWSTQLQRLPGWGEQSQCSGSWREDEERPQSKECSHHGQFSQSYFKVCLVIGLHLAARNVNVVTLPHENHNHNNGSA